MENGGVDVPEFDDLKCFMDFALLVDVAQELNILSPEAPGL